MIPPQTACSSSGEQKHGPQRQLELTVGSHPGLTTYRLQSPHPLSVHTIMSQSSLIEVNSHRVGREDGSRNSYLCNTLFSSSSHVHSTVIMLAVSIQI
ncbi:hypothetical protein SCLCIDRAFT_678631 [Scleroderma citrinum Foug A]|uniref:Uncharacterized protein n=1 Tax=Scleroderma citrinum Foug A TaxID=1036808 RepID=A0A0C3E6B8_9AGAM|nr:hypothetical protein SCLCIDRAFT_678631 [Scleroderma citrinum Foug A]